MTMKTVACVALINTQQKIFLVQTHKYPGYWQPVGGEFDEEKESPKAAAIRECKEETGFDVPSDDIEHVMNTPFDFGEGTVYFYRCMYRGEDTAFSLQEDEIKASGWFSLPEAQRLTMYPATKRFLEGLVVL